MTKELEGQDIFSLAASGPLSRRRFLQAGLAVPAGLTLAQFIAACGSSGSSGGSGGSSGSSGGSNPNVDPAIQSLAKQMGYDWSDTPDLGNVEVKVGQILALTGAGAFYGKVMGNGSSLAVEHIVKAGGPKLNLVQGDNQSGLPAPSAAAARKFVSQDDVAVIQSSFGPATLAIIPVIEPAKTLAFNPAGATSDQLGKSPYLWMGRPTATDAYPALADYAKKTYPNAKNACILVWNESSALASTDLIKAQWEKIGGTMSLVEKAEIGATDMSSQLARIKATNPDVIFFVLFGGDTGTAIKQARAAGMNQPLIGSDWSPQVHTAAGSADEGFVYVTDPFDPTLGSPMVKLLVDNYKTKFGDDPEPFGASFYENTWFIAELVHRVVKAKKDPAVSQNLLDALKAKPTAPSSMVCKPVHWDLTSHAELGKPQELNKVSGGKQSTIGLIYGAELTLGAQLTC